MMARLGFMPRPLRVGVEIGDRTLKAAWYSHRSGGTLAWRYLQTLRSPEPGPDGLARDLARLLRPLRRARLSAALTMAAPASSMHDWTVTVADPKQAREAVRDDLSKLLPFDVAQAQIDVRVRRQQRVGDQWECEVSLAACEAAPLQAELDALWHAGWTPDSVLPTALALLEAAKALGAVGPEPVALVDVGERRTTIALVEHGDVVYARDVTLGQEHLTEALMSQVSVGDRVVSLSRDEADALMRTAGLPEGTPWSPAEGTSLQAPSANVQLPSATYHAMLQPILEQLAAEVRRTIAFGAQTVKVAAPTRILLSGDGSQLANADRWLSAQLKLPVTRLDCQRFLGSDGAAAAVVCGLALSGHPAPLDLQPASFRQRRVVLRTTLLLWRGLAAAIVLIWLGAGWWQVRHRELKEDLRKLNMQLVEFEPVATLQENVGVYRDLVQRLSVEQGLRLEWFRQLASEFPSPVRLAHLSVASTRDVSMTGEAQEREQTPEAYVSELALWLESARICQGVEVGSSRLVAAAESLVEFTLSCRR